MGSILRTSLTDRPCQERAGLARRGFSLLALWYCRLEQRHRLAELARDPRLLRDLGLTPEAVHGELRKPFWRP